MNYKMQTRMESYKKTTKLDNLISLNGSTIDFLIAMQKNVIYIVICNCCWKFYIGETGDFKVRTCGHKSNTLHPENANCKKLAYHLNKCSSRVQPYFRIYPMYYVDDKYKRKFIEKRFIHRYKPPLNCDL